MLEKIKQRFEESAEILQLTQQRLAGPLRETTEIIISAYKAGRGVFIFGNGGSASDAQHIACELVGRFLKKRRALKAVALTTDTSVISAISNDYGFEQIFVRQLEANAVSGDIAIALSTSGNSLNILAGLKKAREMGMRTIAFTGDGGGRCAELAEVLLDVPCKKTPRIQEAHAVLYHILCELVEDAFLADE